MSDLIVMDSIGEGQYNYHVATPAEISAAHPTCKTCKNWKSNLGGEGECMYHEDSWRPHYDYCNNHTEVVK